MVIGVRHIINMYKPTVMWPSLLYTNPIESRLVLHRAMTGLKSEWWSATRPIIPVLQFFHFDTRFLTCARSVETLLWGVMVLIKNNHNPLRMCRDHYN